MSILYIFVPEAGFSATCDWALRNHESLRIGNGAWTTLPPAKQIVLILAASRVLLTQVQLPAVGQNKLRELLAFAVEDKLLAEPDQVHTVAGARSANGETPVAIIDKHWLRQQLAYLRQHSLRADQMLAETLLPAWQAESWSMVWNGQGGFVRLGLHAGIVVDGGDQQTPPMALMLALEEARAKQSAPQRLLLHAAAGCSASAWSQALALPIEDRGPWSWQNADATAAAQLNLLQGEFAPARKPQAWLQHWRPALALLGLIAAVHIGATLVDWARLKHEQSRLQQSMTSHFKQAFPEAKSIVDPALQMRRNLVDLQRTRGVPDSADLLLLLAQAAPSLQPGQLQTLQYEQDKLQLDLLLTDATQLETLRAQFRALPIHSTMSAAQTTPAGLQLRLTLGGAAKQ